MAPLRATALTSAAVVFLFSVTASSQTDPAQPAPSPPQAPAQAVTPPAPPQAPAQAVAPPQAPAQAVAPPAPAPPPGPLQSSGAGIPVVSGELPGSFKVPGTDTSLVIYGHVHVDTTFDINSRVQDYNNNDWASVIFVQPLDGSDDLGASKKGQFFLTPRTSRLGVMSSTPTKIGKLVAKIEADFNGPNSFQSELVTNSTVFRLRHAYAEVAGLLIGQTWSNFDDLDSFPDTVDFNPTGDLPLVRQGMIRYALHLGPATLSLAAENARSLTLGANSGSTVDTDRKWYQVPDGTLNFTLPWSFGHVSARAVTLQYKTLDRGTRQGWGAAASGSLKFLGDTLVWGAQGGNGIGRYTFNALLQGAVDTGEQIRLWKSVGYHVGFTHNWTPELRSNLIWSQTFFVRNGTILDVPDGLSPLYNQRIDQGFVNTFWSFTKNAEIGLEYAYGQRRTFTDQKGTQHRINATFHYKLF